MHTNRCWGSLVWKRLNSLLIFLSHFPTPSSFSFSPLLRSHPLNHPLCHLPEAASLLLPLFHISEIPVPLSSFSFNLKLTTFSLFVLSSPLSWHKLSHTNSGECQECARSCSIMLLLHIWLQPQNLRSVSVFPEPMAGRMDGCRRRMIDEEVGQCWPSP